MLKPRSGYPTGYYREPDRTPTRQEGGHRRVAPDVNENLTTRGTYASTLRKQIEIQRPVPTQRVANQAHQHRPQTHTRRRPPVITWLKKIWAEFCNTMDRLEEEAGLKNQRKK